MSDSTYFVAKTAHTRTNRLLPDNKTILFVSPILSSRLSKSIPVQAASFPKFLSRLRTLRLHLLQLHLWLVMLL